VVYLRGGQARDGRDPSQEQRTDDRFLGRPAGQKGPKIVTRVDVQSGDRDRSDSGYYTNYNTVISKRKNSKTGETEGFETFVANEGRPLGRLINIDRSTMDHHQPTTERTFTTYRKLRGDASVSGAGDSSTKKEPDTGDSSTKEEPDTDASSTEEEPDTDVSSTEEEREDYLADVRRIESVAWEREWNAVSRYI